MDGGASVGTGTGGSGPAPFLLKTYEMVDDVSTDAIVSWSGSKNSFVVWNPPEFARVLLPSYFKHNNFSSFIRQLNTYGFRKIDPERWEFANEDFVKDQKHLLKNIHRRKPIHSHSQPQGSVDPERAAFEEEMDKLSREKSDLEGKLLDHKQQSSSAKEQLENLTQRIGSMERRQEKLLAYLDKAIQSPGFVERLAQKLESMDFSAYNKKRRLPPVDQSPSVLDNLLVDNQSSCRSEFGNNISHQDLHNKLRLELSPAVSDVNLLSHSTQSSNDDGINPQSRTDELSKDVHGKAGFLCHDMLDLSDTGTSFTLKMDSSVSGKLKPDGQKLQSVQNTLISNEEGDCNISCLLNLTLASSPLELNKSQSSGVVPISSQEICTKPTHKEDNTKGRSPHDAKNVSSSHDAYNNKQGSATVTHRVNDVFWEQFLTERPGCSDTEEACSSLRANPYDEQDENKSSKAISRSTKSM